MAVFDNITLNGEKLLVQDTSTANSVMQVNEQVQDIITAVDGKPTADVTYDNTTSTLKIDTDTISVNTNTPTVLSADGDIASISLNGVSHAISADSPLRVFDFSLGTVTFNPSGATTYTPYKSVPIPSYNIVSVTPMAPTALYPFAITIYPDGNSTRMVGAAFGTHGDTTPNVQEVFARIVYVEDTIPFEPIQ